MFTLRIIGTVCSKSVKFSGNRESAIELASAIVKVSGGLTSVKLYKDNEAKYTMIECEDECGVSTHEVSLLGTF
jgi:hypothetical protein